MYLGSYMAAVSDLPACEEGVHHIQHETQAWVSNRCMGTGVLTVGEQRLTWTGPDTNFSLEYRAINMHAISRDHSAFPQVVFLQFLYLCFVFYGLLTAGQPLSGR